MKSPLHRALPGIFTVLLMVSQVPVAAQGTQVSAGATNNANGQVCAVGVATCTWVSPDGLASSHGAGHATVGGPMGVVATVTTNGLASGGQSATALAAFTDLFTLSNVPPGGTAQFSMHLTGSASVPAGACYSTGTQRRGVVLTPPTPVGPTPCPVNARSNLYFWLDYNYHPLSPVLNPSAGTVHDFIPQPFNSNFTNVSGVYDGIFNVSVPVVAGTVPVRFVMFANAALHVFSPGTVPPPGGFTGTASSDFFSTAVLNSIRFFDANGLDVSNQVGFLAASGVPYQIGLPDEAVTVPEPATMALLAGGLALLGGASRRRARAGPRAP
jgi:hypothetical protein